ncbi:MAG: Jag N-terminal domain-containing protein [Selenomonadaceae bacterium]|nr:Jag N-terminal domain-containing protein [Selenomonadaceae bacterium]
MAKIIEKTGKTVEDALSAALEELGVAAENVEYEILEKPSKGFLGFGAKLAKIQVKLKEIPAAVETEIQEPVSKIEAHVEENISEKIEPVLEETKTEPTEIIPKTEIPTEEIKTEKNIPTEEIAPVEENKIPFDKNAVIDAAKNFLAEVFAAMKMEVAVTALENESEVVLDLAGKNLGVLIGKHGQTLDALQYLTNLAANAHDSEEKVYFVLDVENYRSRRAAALTKLSKSVAERAIRTKQDVKLEPMSRSERKVIHTALQNNPKVETHSAGEDPYRYIIVSPKKKR